MIGFEFTFCQIGSCGFACVALSIDDDGKELCTYEGTIVLCTHTYFVVCLDCLCCDTTMCGIDVVDTPSFLGTQM